MEKGASLAVKNIGKPCTGEPYARFDEGALRMKGLLEHVVAACGKASVKEPEETCRISALLYPELRGVKFNGVSIYLLAVIRE